MNFEKNKQESKGEKSISIGVRKKGIEGPGSRYQVHEFRY